MDCCAIRRMPCPKSLISKLSYTIPSVFFPLKSLCNNDPQGLLFAANKEPPCQEFLKLELGVKNTQNIDRLES
jgi:hypothetical protein